MNNENRYIKPELEIIEFNNEDIILTSNESGSFGDPVQNQVISAPAMVGGNKQNKVERKLRLLYNTQLM